MKDEDFPAVYRAASESSARAQATLLRLYRANSVLLVAAALLSLLSFQHRALAVVATLLFLASLSLYIFERTQDLQSIWYQSRALAESVRTATWKLIMSADPFHDGSRAQKVKRFCQLLDEVLSQNKSIGGRLAVAGAGLEQVTPEMLKAIDLSFEEKRDLYLSERIDHQRGWYAKKSCDNADASRRVFWAVVVAYSTAILLLLFRVADPSYEWLPIELFAVVASSLIGWGKLKRHDELASSYALTAHEVGIIKNRFHDVQNEGELSKFVCDAENAFSREHTQWAARRDH